MPVHDLELESLVRGIAPQIDELAGIFVKVEQLAQIVAMVDHHLVTPVEGHGCLRLVVHLGVAA